LRAEREAAGVGVETIRKTYTLLGTSRRERQL
jgi:hypothetical protein